MYQDDEKRKHFMKQAGKPISTQDVLVLRDFLTHPSKLVRISAGRLLYSIGKLSLPENITLCDDGGELAQDFINAALLTPDHLIHNHTVFLTNCLTAPSSKQNSRLVAAKLLFRIKKLPLIACLRLWKNSSSTKHTQAYEEMARGIVAENGITRSQELELLDTGLIFDNFPNKLLLDYGPSLEICILSQPFSDSISKPFAKTALKMDVTTLSAKRQFLQSTLACAEGKEKKLVPSLLERVAAVMYIHEDDLLRMLEKSFAVSAE